MSKKRKVLKNKMIRRYLHIINEKSLVKVIFILYLLLTTNSLLAQTETKQETKTNPEEISMKQRFGFRTNAVDWVLTIPNISVEFDLGNTIRSKRTISAGLKWNWRTSHQIAPPQVFNIFDARVEWRQYFRTRQRGGVTENPGLYTRLKERVFTTKRVSPRTDRAYFWGIYAHASNYSIKFAKEGKQGTAYGAGLSLGYTKALYGYEKGYIDLELGGSVGLIYNSYDVYTHDKESNVYGFDPAKSKSGIVPFPVITDLRAAFVYRFMSVADKYKASAERRIDRINDKRNAANAIIQNMRVRIDSIDIAVRKKGGTGPDSLLTKEELKQWELMKKERKAQELKKQEEQIRQEAAASLGIVLSDTLSNKQKKAIEDEMDKRRKALKEAEKPVDPEKAKKKAEKEKKEAEKKAKKEAEKKAKKDKKEKKEEAKEPEETVATEKEEEAVTTEKEEEDEA